MAYSGNGEISGKTLSIGYGIVKEDGSYNDYQGKDLAGKIAVLNVSSPDGVHPHSAYAAYHSVNQRLKLAKAKGAAAVLLINPEKTASDVPEFFKAINSIDIPVLFVRNEQPLKNWPRNPKSEPRRKHESATARDTTSPDSLTTTRYAPSYWSPLRPHRYGRRKQLVQRCPAIHNGADDNGSGTTLLLEAIRYYGKRQDTNYNYVILFFSAEESGLYRLEILHRAPDFPIETVEYMINFDMVGRLRDNRLQVSGTCTAEQWDEILDAPIHDLDIKKDPAGVGPSDHTSFYYKNLPVLHLFT